MSTIDLRDLAGALEKSAEDRPVAYLRELRRELMREAYRYVVLGQIKVTGALAAGETPFSGAPAARTLDIESPSNTFALPAAVDSVVDAAGPYDEVGFANNVVYALKIEARNNLHNEAFAAVRRAFAAAAEKARKKARRP